jgi:hypothetical protein
MERKFAENAKEKDKKDGSDSDLDSDDGKKPDVPIKLFDLLGNPPPPPPPLLPLWHERHDRELVLHRFGMKRHYAVKTYG